MKEINTFPIENFLEKARIVLKTNQKSLILDKSEVEDLYNCLALTMTRLAGTTAESAAPTTEIKIKDNIQVKMDGGLF
jgi:hypothetical protein